jgi:hypothetical protein
VGGYRTRRGLESELECLDHHQYNMSTPQTAQMEIANDGAALRQIFPGDPILTGQVMSYMVWVNNQQMGWPLPNSDMAVTGVKRCLAESKWGGKTAVPPPALSNQSQAPAQGGD